MPSPSKGSTKTSPKKNKGSEKSKSPSPKSTKPSPQSKGKKSPKKNPKEETGPPIECGIQTEPSCVCYMCFREFRDNSTVQAHLLLMNHLPPYTALNQLCRGCNQIIKFNEMGTHKCVLMKAHYIRHVFSPIHIKYGPPYRCLFCRSRIMDSRADLVAHLLSFHRLDRKRGTCGSCSFTFNEPSPQPAKMPSPPKGGDEEALKAYNQELMKSEEKRLCEPEAAELSPALQELDNHTRQVHSVTQMLWARKNLTDEFQLRQPYACTLCGYIGTSNVDFHGHILSRHANEERSAENLRICAQCHIKLPSEESFSNHVTTVHVGELKRLAGIWNRFELMQDTAEAGDTCATCWQTFRHPYDLQAHLVVAHTSREPRLCGWCQVDYRTCPNPIRGFRVFLRHESNHGRMLHESALNTGYTFEPLADPLPEELSIESLLNEEAEKEASKVDNSKSKKGKASKQSKSPSPTTKSNKSAKAKKG